MMDANGGASPEIKREGRSRSRSPLNSSPKDRNRNSSRDSSSTRERDRSQRNRRSISDGRGDDRRRSRAPSNRRVYVANIPYDCKWTDLKDIFREKVGDVSYVELFEDHDGKFRGCGIVEFKDNASVQKAIDVLHRFEIKGRHLVVKEDFDVERDKTGRPVARSGNRSNQDFSIPPGNEGMGGMGGGMSSRYDTYGLSPHFLESLGVTGPLTNRIFVANLDYKVTDKKLQDIFKMAGKVLNIELKTDKEGKSKGHGIVEFDHPVEAVQAISMLNGQKLFARSMSVRMDKYKEESDGLPSKLPAGLQSIGKGLGSGGQPINIKNFGGNVSGAGIGVMGMGGAGPLNTMQGAIGNMGMGMGTGMGTGNIGMMGAAAMGMANMGGMAAGVGTGGGMGLGGMGMGIAAGMGGDRSIMAAGNMGTGMANMGMGTGVAGMGLGNRNTSGMMGGMAGGGTGTSLTGINPGLGGGSGGMANSMNTGMGTGITGSMGMGSSMGMGTGGGAGGGAGNSMDGFGDFDRGSDNYRSPRSSDTVIVRNLPTSYNWQTLRDRFKDIGDVRYTEVKGRGTAIVRFNTERDAQRAVDLMHGIRIDGRPIEVQLY